jgi:hypothetical protein
MLGLDGMSNGEKPVILSYLRVESLRAGSPAGFQEMPVFIFILEVRYIIVVSRGKVL